MDSYKIIDNKFKPGQSYPIVGNEGEVEGIIWISYVHHDFCLRLLQMCHIEVLHLIIEDPFENQSRLPLCTTNGGTSVIFQLLYRSRTGDDIDRPSANLFTNTLPLDQIPSLLF